METSENEKKEICIMEAMTNASRPVPQWVSRLLAVRWYEWLGWLVEAGLTITFISVAVTQFLEDEQRGGWIMIVLTILTCVPGAWILLKYKPAAGSNLNKFDAGLAIAFGIWAVFFIYLIGFMPQHEQGPFGSP
jgi:hypothetical protein